MVNPVDKTGNTRPVSEQARSPQELGRSGRRGPAAPSAGQQPDQATVSTRGVLASRLAEAARNASGVDAAHVDAVKQRVQEGSYQVSSAALARALRLAEWILRNGG